MPSASRRFFLSVITAFGALAICINESRAGFTHLSIEPHATADTPLGPRAVYRLYANFSEASDRVVSWGGMAGHPLIIGTRVCAAQAGSNFYNSGGVLAPTQEEVKDFPAAQWDTFATIGVAISDHGSNNPPLAANATAYVGVANFIIGNLLNSTTATFFVNPAEAAQARADYAGDGDPQLRVLLAQFTVMEDEHIYGSSIGFLTVKNDDTNQTATLHDLPINILASWGRCCQGLTCTTDTQAGCVQSGGTFIGCEPCSSCPPVECPADISPAKGDSVVNVGDLLAVISAWGACPSPCPPDINADGAVNVSDMLTVISNWGPCD